MRVLIVIPALNEEKTISTVLRRVQDVDLSSLGVEKEVIVVDDGSSDATADIVCASFPAVRLIRNNRCQGKGAAIKRAIEHSDAEYVIIQDADLEYDPADYPRLLLPIVRKEARVVYGSRFLSRGYPTKMLTANYVGNLLGTWMVNFLYGSSLTDLMTGYKVVPADLMKKSDLSADGFDICPELTAKLLNMGVKICEVPISYVGRARKEGKKIKLIDSLLIARSLLRNKNIIPVSGGPVHSSGKGPL
jgi:dolichol-phosphate mannosyltransferase